MACGKCRSSRLSLRIAHQTMVPAGTRMSAIVVSRNACAAWNGATGLSRIVSLMHASM